MARPKIWGSETLSSPIFVRVPKEVADKLENLAYDNERSVAAEARRILCDALGVKKPPRKKPAKKSVG